MHGLTENQIKVLRWIAQGKKPLEICEIEHMAESSVYEAIKRGRGNIDNGIEVLKFAIINNIIDDRDRQKLKQLLSKI